MSERDLYGGLIRLHILHHACQEPIFGLGIIEELARHGYKLSAGTLYPVLHGLERAGYLTSRSEKTGGKVRRVYVATRHGREAVRQAKARIRELFRELFEEELRIDGRTDEPARRSSKTRSATRATNSTRSNRNAVVKSLEPP